MSNRLEKLREACVNYEFKNVDSFSNILKSTALIFPSIDQEVSKLFSVNRDTFALWMDGSIAPYHSTQKDIVRYIHSKTHDFKEDLDLTPSTNQMIVYDSRMPAKYIAVKLPFFQPWVLYLRSFRNSIKAYFNKSNLSIKALSILIDEAQRDREAIFHAKLARKLAKCNNAIVRCIRKNRLSVTFEVGSNTVENARIANAIKEYLRSAGFESTEVMFNTYSIATSGIYIEVNLQQ